MLASNGLTLGFATPEDIPAIRHFIDRALAVLARVVDVCQLLRWNHFDPVRNRLNFACGRLNGDLAGILGFVPTSHFDSELRYASDLWLVMWKARKDAKLPGLGVALLNYIRRELTPQNVYSVGNNEQVAALIYRVLGFDLIDLDHFYRANPLKPEFELMSGAREVHDFAEYPDVSIRVADDELHTLREVIEIDYFVPRKSVEYVRNRYLRHPFYHYDVLGVWRDDRPLVLVVARKVTVGTVAAVRIVDMFAHDEDLVYAGPAIQKLILDADAEYADFYCHGYNPDGLLAAGLVRKQPDVIVPNYFEPFERRNVPIHCAVLKTTTCSLRIVRGDADQDRPNDLPYSE